MCTVEAEVLLKVFVQFSLQLRQARTCEEAAGAAVSALEAAGFNARYESRSFARALGQSPERVGSGDAVPPDGAVGPAIYAGDSVPRALLQWRDRTGAGSAPCIVCPMAHGGAKAAVLVVSHPGLCAEHLPVFDAFAYCLDGEMRRLESAAENASCARVTDKLGRTDRLSMALVQSLDARSILEQSLAALVDVAGGERGVLYSLEGNSLRVAATCGLTPEEDASAKRHSLSLGRGTVGEVAQSSEVRVGQFPAIADILPYGLAPAGESSNAVFVPIRGKEHFFGVLVADFLKEQDYRQDDLHYWENVGRQIGLAAENARLFEIVRRSRGRFRQLIDTANAVIFELDANGRFSHFNNTAEQVSGYTRQELIGQPFELLVEEERRPEAKRLWGRIWSAKRSVNFEFPIRARNAEERLIHWSTAEDIDESERKAGVVFVGQDITRQKELESSLSQAKKLAALGTMISGVAHELNNPLTAIIGFSEFLVNDKSLSDEARGEIETIFQQGQRCREVVDNLLHFSRKEIGARVGVDVNRLIQECLQLREYQFHLGEVTMRTEFDEKLPSIVGDPTQLRTALLNVINNAFDAIGERDGGGTLWVRTRTLLNERIVIEVEDTGGGVQNPERVFEPFYTTKGVGKGTGLGLSATYGIVVDHGGSIRVKNTDKGALFTIELPVAPGVSKEIIGAPGKELTSKPGAGGKRVLVVDDEPPVAKLMAHILEDRGYSTAVELQMDPAVERLQTERFDAIVCEVRMPGKKDGIWLFEWLRENRPEMLGKTLFLSGDLISERVKAFVAECPQAVLPKPFAIQEFVKRVDGFFQQAVGGSPSEGAPG